MPTNLPPDAKKKWAEVENTRNPREKLRLLEEFLSLVPRHKGTAKLCVSVKKRMALLQKEIDEKKRKKAGRTGPKIFMEKEGAAQIALLGLTKSGKSSLLAAVTNAKPEISSTPYTTMMPFPGVMSYEDIQFQMIETPALMVGSVDRKAWGTQTLAIARNADGLALVLDLTDDPAGQLSTLLAELEKSRILVSKPQGKVEVERKFPGAGLRILQLGKIVDGTIGDVEALLKSYRVNDAIVRIEGRVTLDDVEDAIFERPLYKPAVIVANKIDAPLSLRHLEKLREFVGDKLPIVAVSAKKRTGLDQFGDALFRTLDIMRVYTKEPAMAEHSRKPFILKSRACVQDLARSIHSDFKTNFAFAKVWSERLVFSPQKVGLAFALADGDIVEIHTN
jgi:ribosome-interacting GTPase 1